MIARMRSPQVGRIGALVAAAAIGGLIATMVLAPRGSVDGISQVPGIPGDVESPILRALDPSEPLMPSGKQVELSQAEENVGYAIYLPSPQAVNGETPEVWYSSATNEVAARFGSELFIEYAPWGKDQGPAKEYAQQAESWHVGQLTEIGGNPAWLIPAHAGGDGVPPVAVVHVSMGGLDITLYGGQSVEDLAQVAATLSTGAQKSAAPGGSA